MIKHIWVLSFLLLEVGIMFAQNGDAVFKLAGLDIILIQNAATFDIDIKTSQVTEGVEIATLKMTHPTGASPEAFSLKWKIPSSNIAGYWSTNSFVNKTIKPDWWPSEVRSMLAREAPVMCLYGHDDVNRINFSVSEALNTVVLTTSVKEEDGMIYNEIKFFSERHKKLKTYEVQIRMDTRAVPYSETLADVAEWWASFELYKPSLVPEVARLPVYSSWYSYHQNVSPEELLKECALAKKMGFESIIVDDGWQTLDSNRGYAYTGDWEPERIPNMKEFVEAVHDLDMKFILWYAIPLVGEKSRAYEKMKGKFLRYWDGQGAYELDPRYPDVRKFIIDTYIKAVNEWDLDGFKLDFIARFTSNKNTELMIADGRDFASVNEATDVLMTNLIKALKEIKPDIMIEFRQPYTGPAMRKYGNMFRAGDCPNLAMINRVRTSDLRLISGNTAVHSDMLMWHYEEAVEVAALQLLNILFSVPQISVRLADIPEDHLRMIQFYTKYCLENRNVLLDGEFHPAKPLANYPLITGWADDKRITALFDDQVVLVETGKEGSFDLINAKPSTQVVILVDGQQKQYQYVVKDCLGKEIKRETVVLEKGVFEFEVPYSGMISFNKMN